MRLISVLIFIALYVLCALCNAQVPDSLNAIFKYTRVTIPVYNTDSSFSRNGIEVDRITYISTDSFVVAAYLTGHKNIRKNNPLIIFNHWGEGDKDEFLDEAILFSSMDFVCILPDGPWLCPNTPIQSFKRQGYEMYRQYAMNTRVAIDLAEQQLSIDTNRIFCVGHSFGCNTAAILSAVDKRINYFVFMAGANSTTENIANSTNPDFVEWKTSDPLQFKKWVTRVRPLDAELYLPYKTSPCLIQTALNDEYISAAENARFSNNTPPPKEVKKYNSTHKLNKEAQDDRIKWMMSKIKK